ncbi:AraC-like ligand-binding domain-containing protein [Leucobacter sp. HY1910]
MTVTGAPIAHSVSQNITSFAEFREAVSDSFVPLAVRHKPTPEFQGRVCSTRVDRFAFAEVAAGAHEVERTPQLISRGRSEYYKVGVLLSGRGLLVQDNRELTLSPGDIAIYDTGRPYSLEFDAEFRNFVFMLPKETLDIPLELMDQLVASRLCPASPVTALLAQHLPLVPQATAHSSAVGGTHIARSTVGLVEAVCLDQLGTDPVALDPKYRLLQEVRDYIDSNLASPTLSPPQIAAAHYISVRHLHSLFRAEGVSVSAWIRARRLERCQRELADVRLAHHAISVIASRSGFVDAAHFSKLFRSHTGVTPREFRSHAHNGSAEHSH